MTGIVAIDSGAAIPPERIKSRQPRSPGRLSSEYECLLIHGDIEGFYEGDGFPSSRCHRHGCRQQ